MRESGILMPVSSLPGPYGIGCFGKEAFKFVDFLAQAGQKIWQILPLSPTGYGDSPYQSCSAFAGNPYFIDLDTLAAQGLLKPKEYKHIDWQCTPEQINYGALYEKRYTVLRTACERLLAAPPADYRDFVRKYAREPQKISDFFIHVVCRTGWQYVFEVVSHDIPYEEAQGFMKSIREYSFAGWKRVME